MTLARLQHADPAEGAVPTVEPGKVSMYVCGPTVYKPSHIGHMVGPVIFDTVKRYLTYLGYRGTLVVNITDVDDKLIMRPRKLNTTVKELAERMTADYRRMPEEAERRPASTQLPRATEHIGDMIEIIAGLIDKGYAYPAGGDVYFDVAKDEDYGKLCNRDPEQLEAGARIEVSDEAQPRRLRPVERRPSPASRRGTARGGRAGPAGTSNARP